ncbi:MAG: ATP cone domain-containing protein [Daejeonella sp.]|uniref:ATP cone domain-containing protein n=1 Tax=Daejeonella sp. TaxID=2805397 RepID=UPI002735D5AA|nr:ATP cone domain-containing protein [Daejeonella sp.]MDP3469343.1 ATP cone domain-containing protein [Daejeonella sp.]
MNSKQIYVTKMSGEKALFDEEKLRNSLKRSKADNDVINQVIEQVKYELKDDISTREIYRMAFAYLRKKASHSAARYKLKQSILELGPTGFPFEEYVSELLKYKNYRTEVGNIVEGHCVSHEIDIIAERENRHILLECKFHSDQRRFCDVKVPLYIYSRFKDVEQELKKNKRHNDTEFLGGLVTNTRFSSDALKYGICMGMYLISWDYPVGKSLKFLIDQSGLHPLTSLLTLSKFEKQQLLDKRIILCKNLIGKEKVLREIQISEPRIKKIISEVEDLCNPTE